MSRFLQCTSSTTILDKSKVDQAFQSLQRGEARAREDLAEAALPMATIVARKFVIAHPGTRKRYHCLVDAGIEAIGEAIVSLEKRMSKAGRNPLKHSIRTYLNMCIKNAVKRTIVEELNPGYTADEIFKRDRDFRLLSSTKIEFDDRVRQSKERLDRLIELAAPQQILDNEKRSLAKREADRAELHLALDRMSKSRFNFPEKRVRAPIDNNSKAVAEYSLPNK